MLALQSSGELLPHTERNLVTKLNDSSVHQTWPVADAAHFNRLLSLAGYATELRYQTTRTFFSQVFFAPLVQNNIPDMA
jgi:hypothetical protein